jgi:hypothetical protein
MLNVMLIICELLLAKHGFTQTNSLTCGTLSQNTIIFPWLTFEHMTVLINVVNDITQTGHSIGSIIIRTALTRKELLPFVEGYDDGNENDRADKPKSSTSKLGTMLSLSSPMLGSRFSESTLVATGMWIFKRVRKSMALEQVSSHAHEQAGFAHQIFMLLSNLLVYTTSRCRFKI